MTGGRAARRAAVRGAPCARRRARPTEPTTRATRSGSAPSSMSRANRSRRTQDLPVPAPPVTSSDAIPVVQDALLLGVGGEGRGRHGSRCYSGATDSPRPTGGALQVGAGRDPPGRRLCADLTFDTPSVPALDVGRRPIAPTRLPFAQHEPVVARIHSTTSSSRSVGATIGRLVERRHAVADGPQRIAPTDLPGRIHRDRAHDVPGLRHREGLVRVRAQPRVQTSPRATCRRGPARSGAAASRRPRCRAPGCLEPACAAPSRGRSSA